MAHVYELCQYLGHGEPRFFKDSESDGVWAVEVPISPKESRTFVSDCRARDSISGRKPGRKAAAGAAIPALTAMIGRGDVIPQARGAQGGVAAGDRVGANPTTRLLELSQKFGWSVRFDKEAETGAWGVEVLRGVSRDVFRSDDTSLENNKGTKRGRAAAAVVALEGLGAAIEAERATTKVALVDAFGPHFRRVVRVQESSAATWAAFWAHPPAEVGVDVEGNQQRPPCLVQVATPTTVILEAPSRRRGGLSADLRRLLADDSIVKVFCDSTGSDRRSLGLPTAADSLPPDMVDIEAVGAKRLGDGSSIISLGLAKIMSMYYTVPTAAFRVVKSDDGLTARFSMIEQGHAPQLDGVSDLTDVEREYAALDAWVTLLAWAHVKAATTVTEPPSWSVIKFHR